MTPLLQLYDFIGAKKFTSTQVYLTSGLSGVPLIVNAEGDCFSAGMRTRECTRQAIVSRHDTLMATFDRATELSTILQPPEEAAVANERVGSFVAKLAGSSQPWTSFRLTSNDPGQAE